MSVDETKHIEPEIMDQAIAWQARLSRDVVTDADRVSHMEWMLEQPSHLEAFETVAATIHEASQFESQARAAFAEDFAVPPSSSQGSPDEAVVGKFWHRKFWSSLEWPQFATGTAIVAALLFVAIFPNTSLFDTPSVPRQYSANAESVREIKLADGSRVTLFANSSISVQMTDDMRSVDLQAGRAFFDVISNAEQPFFVNTGARQIKVVGTRFEVMRADSFDRVAVNEGLVAVSSTTVSDNALVAPILIDPGTVALYEGKSDQPALSKVDATTIGAWTNGVLVFRDTPIFQVLKKLSDLFPHNTLSVSDGSLNQKNFSGTLVVSSAERMMRQLAEFAELDIEHSDTIITLKSK